MFGFGAHRHSARLQPLGPLEAQVMEVVWARGESNVREVAERLPRPLAYTTVMTTLDRLFKKGLLERRKCDRAFRYATRLSRAAWERERAQALVAQFLSQPETSRDMLFSSLLDAAGPLDQEQLAALEKKIRRRRQHLAQQVSKENGQ